MSSTKKGDILIKSESRSDNVFTMLQFGLSILFIGWSFAIVWTPTFKIKDHQYLNLHALEYPLVPDLSLVGFKTPGLASRLASTWEVEKMLAQQDATAKAENMVYPTVEKTAGMNSYLMKRVPVNTTCGSCSIQSSFAIANAFNLKQTQFYCPTRSENIQAWETRTMQSRATDQTLDDSTFNRIAKFHDNSEHAETCRASRVPPMFLAHVATDIFSLFSAQNTIVIFLYVTTVNALFSVSVGLYMWYTSKIGNAGLGTTEKRQLHGLFTVLFCFVLPLTLLPMVIDYYKRTNSNDNNRAFGSYIIGAWTLLLSFVYIGVLPSMNVRLSKPEDAEAKVGLLQTNTTNADEDKEQERSKELQMLDCLAHYQPLITFAYWNALQTPCFVMILAVASRYGIDLYLQYLLFGALASGFLDIVHARLNIILRIMKRCNPHTAKLTLAYDVLVELTFLVMHVIIASVVYIKLFEMNVQTSSIFIVAILFLLQPIQDFGLVVWDFYKTKKDTTSSKTTFGMSSKWQYRVSLLWHEIASVIVFIITFTNVNAS